MWHCCLSFFLIVMVGDVLLLSNILLDCDGRRCATSLQHSSGLWW